MKCEWCGKENDDRVEVVIQGVGRFKTCGECLNYYANGEYDKIKFKKVNPDV